ncbi:hypothetical protein [Nocardioides sp. ChNu-99]|uniref:hypothetical protein n=1 Tax=Nocardioides sp. ChNu-99 TaxID=2839897 RepID=UPI00240595ED|nr:hypothetical protein [Nocardioides sp. ChNu-99]MDF9716467.1 hypothetical protein [Nocardioides sp. ChNu-99]
MDTEDDSNVGRLDPPALEGPQVRRGRRAGTGWYAPLVDPAPSTTRQGEILNPALIGSPTDEEGIPIGSDLLSGSPVAHDPFTAYRLKRITSPSVVVLGAIGSGKSSLIKTVYVVRAITLKQRRAIVLDRKDQDGEGEYSALTRAYGGSLFQMRVGEGGTRLNPLDPHIREVLGAAGQYELLLAMATRANGGEALDHRWEAPALRVAHRRALGLAEAEGRDPVISDVIGFLGVIDGVGAWRDYSPAARERMHQAGLGMRHLLEATLADQLQGLFDGPTSSNVSLDSRLTTFDISQLPQDGPAMGLVLAVAHSWTLGTLRKERGMATNFVAEEGWDMVAGPIAEHMNARQMLARGLGLCNVAALHHLSQIPEGSKALSLVKEPETVHIYRQDRADDIAACARVFDLDESARQMLPQLEQGTHLLKIGNRQPVHVDHVRSTLEERLTDTDGAMLMTSRQAGLPDADAGSDAGDAAGADA